MQTPSNVTSSIEERVAASLIEAAVSEALAEASLELYIQECIDAEFSTTNLTLYSKLKAVLSTYCTFFERYMSHIVALWIVVALARFWGYDASDLAVATSSNVFRESEGRLLTRPQPRPRPFFSNASIVDDYYMGNGGTAELLSNAEIAVLMFYAPWSLDSQLARGPYDAVANVFSDISVVKFSAVNCYTNYGHCKRAFKLFHFPVIIAYAGKIQIPYDGAIDEISLFNFVSNLLYPIERVSSGQQLSNLLSRYDHLVTGYFPLNNHIALREYTTFTAAAMKATTFSDYFANTRFITVHSPDLADHLQLDLTNRIRFISGNLSDVIRPFKLSSSLTIFQTTTSDQIVEYAKKVLDQEHTARPRLQWIHLDAMEAGGKSENLQSILKHSPAMFLFSTEYPGMAESSTAKVVRETADSYHSCGPARLVSSALPVFGDVVADGQKACAQSSVNFNKISSCCTSFVASGACSTSTSASKHNDCDEIIHAFGENNFQKQCCHGRRNQKELQRLFSPSMASKIACRWFKNLQNKKSSNVVSSKSDDTLVHGLGCVTNETIHFYGVDRNYSEFFIRQWGIAPSNYWSTASEKRPDLLVLISTEREAIHVLKGPITHDSVAQLLKDFHASKLTPTPIQAIVKPSKTPSNLLSIKPLRRNEFSDFLKTPKSYDSIIYFMDSRYHGPSTTIAHSLLTVASYFSDFGESIKFYKIDASIDELPFEYIFDRLPALVFFPANKLPGVGAIRYPSSLPFTVPNTFAFIVSQLNPELRWRFALSTCSLKCFSRNRRRIHSFLVHVDSELRRLRTARTHVSRRVDSHDRAIFLRGLIQRRVLQRKAAVHLGKVLQMVADGKEEPNIDFLRQNMFVRWLLYNTLGQTSRFM